MFESRKLRKSSLNGIETRFVSFISSCSTRFCSQDKIQFFGFVFTLLNKYKLTVIAALAHRQMHLSVLFRFHCTTKADHAIDLSPWMVFRVLNWFDYRINLCMTEREKSQWKPTHTHLIITLQFLLSNSSCIAFEICAVNVFVFAHLMSLQWRTPTFTHTKSPIESESQSE